MTALGVSLLVLGALLITLEAHVPTLGMLGIPGVLAVGAGALLALAGLGGGVVVSVLGASVLVLAGFGVVGVSLRKASGVRRRRVRTGPEGLIGHVGTVRSWTHATGKVLVDGALWRARPSLSDEPEDAELQEGDPVIVERLDGLTLAVRRAEEWELVR